MENLIQKISELYSQAQALVTEYKQKLAELRDAKAVLEKDREDLDVFHHNLRARESECQKVENAVDLHEKAINLHDATNVRVNALAEAEKSLKARKDEFDGKCRETSLINEKKAKINEDRSKAIDDEVTKHVQDVLKKSGLKG